MTRLLALAALVVALTPPPCPAADPAPGSALEYAVPTPPPGPDPAGLIVRLVVLTASLIGLGLAVAWMARRNGRPAVVAGDGGRIVHEGTLPLGRGCALHLLRVDGQTVAVTTDPAGLRSVVVLSEPFESLLAGPPGPEAEAA